MKKFGHSPRRIISLAVIAILLIALAVVIRINHSKRCRDIIGDGYEMGTDPTPVVIGNTCDK